MSIKTNLRFFKFKPACFNTGQAFFCANPLTCLEVGGLSKGPLYGNMLLSKFPDPLSSRQLSGSACCSG